MSERGLWDDDTVTYTYANRLRTGMTLAEPTSSPWSQTYAYDDARRLTNTTSSAGAFGYVYDATRRLQVQKLSLPNGAAITNSYDNVDRLLVTALVNSSGAPLNWHSYGYNVGNQRTNQTFSNTNYQDYAERGRLMIM